MPYSPTYFALLALVGLSYASAQQVGQNAASGISGTVTFTTGTQLVAETVVVTDKKNNPVEGLTAKDFTVTEDGVKQAIRVFEYQTFKDTTLPQLSSGGRRPHVYDKLGRSEIAPEASAHDRYKDRRLLAVYFDMTSMSPVDQMRALTATENFIRIQMTAADLLAIMRYEGGVVEVLQDFTSDRDRLLSILETMIVGEGQGFDETTADASAPDTAAAFGQDDTEFNIFNTDRQLSALQTAVGMLGRLSEKKSLIYFASGLRLNRLNNQAQLQATINAAIRAGVSFWPIDARGLAADAPMGDATKGSPGNIGMYSGIAALANTSRFQQSQDTLYSLGADTGGKALLDTNDLASGIRRAQQSVSSYYLIGYYSANTAQDGKFRRVTISLNNSFSANLDYRHGYFASKQFRKFTAADKERQLEDALMLEDPITDLTIAMEIDYFQLNRAEYFVPVSVKIPGREMALAKRGGAEHTLLDFIGEIRDDYGSTVTNVRDKADIKLSSATSTELAKRPIEYDTGFTLLPGTYIIKFLARDAETGRIGTYQTRFVIPNLNKEVNRVPISSVILSSQRLDLKDAQTVNPLVRNSQKLIPSVTRVFSKGRELYVYLQAYQTAAPSAHPLIAFVAMYQGNKNTFETQPVKLTSASGGPLHTIPIEFSLPLRSFAAGEYNCQVTVLDPADHKAVFWEAPIVLVP